MNILLIHNSYQQPGGEDQVFELEASLLQAHGHNVIRFQEHNEGVKERSNLELLSDTVWNRWIKRQLQTLIREGNVDVMHVHNTFPLISPACYYAASAEGIPVVQTLHNYRLLCPSATLYRDGRVCEDCLGKLMPWPSVVHSCYRGSRSATAVAASMLTIHNSVGTWHRRVSAFLALTEFARSKFIQGGLPEDKILVKPNFLQHDPGMGSGDGEFALFLGRLTAEKGIGTLLKAWQNLGASLQLQIVGDGPLAGEVSAAAGINRSIEWLGWLSKERVFERMKRAKVVILPSEWYEAFPMTVVEAFATGVPVIASKLGSLAALIEHRKTGLHFNPGDADDLARQIRWLNEHPGQTLQMRVEARREFLQKYTGDRNYLTLMAVYDRIQGSGRRAFEVLPEVASN